VVPLGRWNIRRYVLAGRNEFLQSHFRRIFEEVIRKIFQTAEKTGKDIDQFHAIGDIGGFNNRQHLCLACIPVYTGFAQSSHSGCAHFPRNVTLVNSKRNEFV